MIPSYASFRSQPPNSFTLTAIPGTAENIARNFYIQFVNRAGRSLLSAPKSITSTGVRITLEADLILDTEEVFWVAISYETTSDPEDAQIVATWQARENDQVLKRSLPVDIDLTTDEHFVKYRSVLNTEDLPATGILDGAIAFNAETNQFYRYDSEAFWVGEQMYSYGAIASGTGNWVEYSGTSSAYISAVTADSGSDRALFTVDSALKIPPKLSSSDSTPQRYWLNNGFSADGGSPIVKGQYTFEIAVNGTPGYQTVFANKIKYYLQGYINRDTLDLDTTVPDVGVERLWNPTNGLITLPVELPRNYAAVYDLVLSFDNDKLLGLLPEYSEISLNITEVEQIKGAVSEIAKVIGDLVFSDRQKLLIVPGLKRLGGIATIGEGFIIDLPQEQVITGVAADTPDQIAAIAGNFNGLATIRGSVDELQYSEVIRAFISTDTGESQVIAGTAITLVNNQGVSVTLTHPCLDNGLGVVRTNYPDTWIAGNEQGRFTPQNAYIYLDVDGTLYQSPVQNVTPTREQTVNFTSLDNFTQVQSLPVQEDDYFSLFVPDNIIVTAIATGDIQGTVTPYVSYVYTSPNYVATSIRHERRQMASPRPVLGGGRWQKETIPTAKYTLAQAINRSLIRDENLGDLVDVEIARENLEVYPKTELDEHKGDRNNPHQVTRSQLGAASQADLNSALALINANTTAINNLPVVDVFSVLDISERDAIVLPSNGDIAQVADNGTGDSQDFYWDGQQWSAFYVPAAGGTTNNVYSVATTTERDAIADPIEGDIAKVADSDGSQNPKDYAWDGTQWLPFVGAISGGANNVYQVSTVTERDALPGVIENDIAKVAQDLTGNPRDYVYDGTGWVAFASAVQTSEEIKASLESLVAPNKLKAGAIAGLADVLNDPIDGYALLYSQSESALVWQYVNRYSSVGAGAILLPLAQSTFTADDGTVVPAYTPDSGDVVWTDIKVISTSQAPDNQIQNGQLAIATIDTGASQDISVSDTVIRVEYLFNTSDCDGIVLRYESDGNMLLLVLSETAIALKEIVADTATTIEARTCEFVDSEKYLIEVQIVGVTYRVSVRNSIKIFQGVSNKFLSATSFGLAKLDPAGVGAIAPEDITEEKNNTSNYDPGSGTGGNTGDTGGNGSSATTELTTDVYAQYAFDNTSNYGADTSGNSRDLTVTGSPTFANGSVSGFSTSSYLYSDSWGSINQGDWTCAVKLTLDSAGVNAGYQTIWEQQESGQPRGGLVRVRQESNGTDTLVEVTLSGDAGSSNNPVYSELTDSTIPYDTPITLTVIRDAQADTTSYYLNSTHLGTAGINDNRSSATNTSSSRFQIGNGAFFTGQLSQPFLGTLTQLEFWTKKLSEVAIAEYSAQISN